MVGLALGVFAVLESITAHDEYGIQGYPMAAQLLLVRYWGWWEGRGDRETAAMRVDRAGIVICISRGQAHWRYEAELDDVEFDPHDAGIIEIRGRRVRGGENGAQVSIYLEIRDAPARRDEEAFLVLSSIVGGVDKLDRPLTLLRSPDPDELSRRLGSNG